MAQPVIQTSFASGELAPKLRSRVDVAKYKQGAALMRNFYVDYSGGGASTRQGTRFVNMAKSTTVRLVPFHPSVSVSYVLEFGQNYIRFFSNGAPILENPVAIQSITPGSPVTFNSTSNGFNPVDWVFIGSLCYIVTSSTTNTFTLSDLFGNPINSFTFTGQSAARVYTINSPYSMSDLFPQQGTGNSGIKWVQDVTSMIITHPSYPPQILTIISANQWTLNSITFGTTVGAPSSPTFTPNLTGTGWYYSYVVTSVDGNGQESAASAPAVGTNLGNINTVNPSSLIISWTAVAGAVSYNVYKASPAYNATVPSGVQYGFVSNVLGTSYQESYPGILPDFSQTPPIISSPITGGNVLTITLTGNANYTQVPSITIPPPSSGFTATAYAALSINSLVLVSGAAGIIGAPSSLGNSPVGLTLIFASGVTANITGATAAGGGLWNITAIGLTNGGSLTGAGTNTPTNPISPFALSGVTLVGGIPASSYNINAPTHTPTFNATWDVGSVILIQGGFGYTSAPTPSFSPAGATAVTTVSPISQSGGSGSATPVGNPRVASFFQERLMFASPNAGLNSFYLSQPGSFFNFNVSNPIQASDAIFGSIVSEELNAIRSLVNVPTGILALTGNGAWLINGGGGISTSNPITPSNVSATPQAFNGANDLYPLKINFDCLYVTNEGSYVRSASYNIYANIFIGQDVTILSNHFFFGHQIVDWTWAEEPFKIAWVVRDDGNLLSMTYVKEQEVIGWAQHDTNGQFLSTASIIEDSIDTDILGNIVDGVYFATSRLYTVTGAFFTFIERMDDRYFNYGAEDAWSVDCGLQTKPIFTGNGLAIAFDPTTVGNTVELIALNGLTPFTPTMATGGYIVRGGGGIYQIASYISSSIVTATVVRVPSLLNVYESVAFTVPSYSIWQPVTVVGGLNHLVGYPVTGVADGVVVSGTVQSDGTVTLSSPATKITLGLAYLPQIQTLPLDTGEPTIQSKRKKLPAATLRVADTLGLQIGTTFANAVAVKDFQLGAIPSQSNGPVLVSGLVNGDGRQILDQVWQEVGQLCIQQNLPYPATILGVMPELEVGDSMGERK